MILFYRLVYIFCAVYLTYMYYMYQQGGRGQYVFFFVVLLAGFSIQGKKIVLYLHLFNTKSYSFQTLSLGFILKTFLKCCKFHLQYCYKIYYYVKTECAFLNREFFFSFPTLSVLTVNSVPFLFLRQDHTRLVVMDTILILV